MTAFTAIIQVGAVARRRCCSCARTCVRIARLRCAALVDRERAATPTTGFGVAVVVGSIPIGIVGLLFKDTIETTLRSLWFVGCGADPVERGDVRSPTAPPRRSAARTT